MFYPFESDSAGWHEQAHLLVRLSDCGHMFSEGFLFRLLIWRVSRTTLNDSRVGHMQAYALT
jgi:hypothetical protein